MIMKSIVPAIVLVAISILLWVVYFVAKKSQSKKTPGIFQSIAEKYGLVYDGTNSVGGLIYPVIKGTYKNRHAAIGSLSQSASGNKDPQTYLRIECNNPRGINFLLCAKTKKNQQVQGGNVIQMHDHEFDEKFIVTGNYSELILSVFKFNVKYSLLQVQHLDLKGELKLTDNLLDYTEPGLIKDENSRTRIELMLHIMSDMADEVSKVD